MILKNPTSNDLEVQIDGKIYRCEAKGEVTLPNSRGRYWVDKIHGFMEIISEEEFAPEVPEEVVEEVEVPVADAVPAEVVVESDGARVRKVAGSKLRPPKK